MNYKLCIKLFLSFYVFFITILFYANKATAQVGENLMIGYETRLQLTKKSLADTLSELRYRSYLIVNATESLFFVDSKYGVTEKINTETGVSSPVVSLDSMQKSYKNFARNEIICEEQLMNTQLWYRDTLHPQSWTIGNENKKIGGYNCLKATCFFRGRHYEGWFTPEIPISNGPWKFGGLPGMILEVYDDARQVQYLFQSMKYSTAGVKTKIPYNKLIDYPLYAAKMKTMIKKLETYMQARFSESTGDAKAKFATSVDTIEKY